MNVFKKLDFLDGETRQLILDLIAIDQEIAKGGKTGLTDLYHERNGIRTELDTKGVDWESITKAVTQQAELVGDELPYSELPLSVRKAIAKKAAPKVKKTTSYKAQKKEPKCAHGHPLITIDGLGSIQGGSCYSPQGKFDVEIFLCYGASLPRNILPWETTFVRYAITDMSVPEKFDEFDKLIDWTIEQMKAGKKVHVGCIGGHGRTGTFLAALVHKATGDKDAIAWVRKNYCTKAVETSGQVDWLNKHYGITKRPAVKSWSLGTGTSGYKKLSPKSFDGTLIDSGADWETDIVSPLQHRDVWGDTTLVY